ncbi:M24 family metallopeptidase [Sulfurisphaera ohwakuensis]|uniref:M24 family metallopeptidase n=1 Tax=Sulfurisphaera ohwakuensis TaxID=69656 RepID=A0A650CKV3_SULOH|nr:aminopeptidase P family protein [Sulfurisphaera ohwakuensis]MBB5252452.1 Xaa-Pro dipeptidase [Sulfurisphaera ohwakuensis]QGR18456.1 M24 family metallopeptidase [Sulfurisphaera ohwakuensis]
MRLHKLKELLEVKGLKCAIITSPASIFYLTGYDYITTDIGNFVALIYCDGIATLIVPLLELYRAQDKVKEIDLVAYSTTLEGEKIIKGSLKDAILNFIKENKIGLDIQNTSSIFYNYFSKFEIIDLSKDISIMRSVKDQEELELIKRAGDITTAAMKIAQDKLTNSEISEKYLAGIIDMTMRTEGAEDYAFPSIVAFAENSAFPHHIPSDKVIKEGQNAVVDIGARYEKYCFDSTRTFLKGENYEIKKIYEIVLQAQLEAIDKVKEGVKASEVDLAARRVIEKAGYGKHFIHSTGHGVGIEVHEYPSISPTSDAELKENMVITIEPGIYLKNKFGIRIEDTVIVTKRKPIVLETTFKYL